MMQSADQDARMTPDDLTNDCGSRGPGPKFNEKMIAAIGDRAHPAWRASAVGVYRLWRDLGRSHEPRPRVAGRTGRTVRRATRRRGPDDDGVVGCGRRVGRRPHARSISGIVRSAG
jgi:hypothetical protein